MPQQIDPETKTAAMAVRLTSMACQQAGREIGCRYCFSERHRGCVYIAEAVIDALFPSPGSNGSGGGGVKARVTA